jgi:hypothetical protein
MRRLFAHIIVEQLHGHWSAWFSGSPETGAGGAYPAEAIRRLLAGIGGSEFDEAGIVSIDEAAREGHLEFRIPYRIRMRLPEVSDN